MRAVCRGAGARAGRHRRQLLRAGGPFAAGDAADQPHPRDAGCRARDPQPVRGADRRGALRTSQRQPPSPLAARSSASAQDLREVCRRYSAFTRVAGSVGPIPGSCGTCRPIVRSMVCRLAASCSLKWLPQTLDDMAADYLASIRQIQPTGPYNLLGWSFGGLVAHAIATHLQDQGESVALLALLDSYPSQREWRVAERDLDDEQAARGSAQGAGLLSGRRAVAGRRVRWTSCARRETCSPTSRSIKSLQ